MQTLSVRTPAHPRVAARTRYVLDWLSCHPYAGGRLRWSFATDAEAAVDLDLAALTERTTWLAAPPRHDCLPRALASAPPARVRHGDEWLYGIGPRRADHLQTQSGHYAFDWVATLFAWLSRWEERLAAGRDAQPPPAREQWLVRHSLERVPRADRLAAALLNHWGLSTSLEPSRVCLTHDLDHVRCFTRPWAGPRHALWVARRGGGLTGGAAVVMRALGRLTATSPDPFDNPGETLKRGGNALYLLLGRHVRRDGGRDRTDARVRRWIAQAEGLGYDIGLHPSYTTPSRPDRLSVEVERFTRLVGRPPTISRQHFLRWRWGTTPNDLLTAGIEFDSTLGFRDRLGFRCGTSFAYRLYDFQSEAPSRLVERPLAAMDTAWLEANAYDPEACASDWRSFAEANRRGTDLVLNIHNSTLPHARWADIDLDAWYRFQP